MRKISADSITAAVSAACVDACIDLPEDVLRALLRARETEESRVGQDVLDQLIENARIAREERMPICQDTGLALVLVELGQDAHIVGGGLFDAIQKGVRTGYDDGYLRKSIVRHPLDRVNTQDNTPAVIFTTVGAGDRLRITIAPKGGGSENMSAARMLKPADGAAGVQRFVLDTVVEADANPCPPIVVGVGLGGTLEMAALLSKKAVLREIGSTSADPVDAGLEIELLEAINSSGIGPSGLGGRSTALAVHVESHPCHIASLPVAVTLQCHAARHKSIEL